MEKNNKKGATEKTKPAGQHCVPKSPVAGYVQQDRRYLQYPQCRCAIMRTRRSGSHGHVFLGGPAGINAQNAGHTQGKNGENQVTETEKETRAEIDGDGDVTDGAHETPPDEGARESPLTDGARDRNGDEVDGAAPADCDDLRDSEGTGDGALADTLAEAEAARESDDGVRESDVCGERGRWAEAEGERETETGVVAAVEAGGDSSSAEEEYKTGGRARNGNTKAVLDQKKKTEVEAIRDEGNNRISAEARAAETPWRPSGAARSRRTKRDDDQVAGMNADPGAQRRREGPASAYKINVRHQRKSTNHRRSDGRTAGRKDSRSKQNTRYANSSSPNGSHSQSAAKKTTPPKHQLDGCKSRASIERSPRVEANRGNRKVTQETKPNRNECALTFIFILLPADPILHFLLSCPERGGGWRGGVGLAVARRVGVARTGAGEAGLMINSCVSYPSRVGVSTHPLFCSSLPFFSAVSSFAPCPSFDAPPPPPRIQCPWSLPVTGLALAYPCPFSLDTVGLNETGLATPLRSRPRLIISLALANACACARGEAAPLRVCAVCGGVPPFRDILWEDGSERRVSIGLGFTRDVAVRDDENEDAGAPIRLADVSMASDRAGRPLLADGSCGTSDAVDGELSVENVLVDGVSGVFGVDGALLASEFATTRTEDEEEGKAGVGGMTGFGVPELEEADEAAEGTRFNDDFVPGVVGVDGVPDVEGERVEDSEGVRMRNVVGVEDIK
ncbi:hypothetical protein C8R43DRAFT_956218 [Mycena crocata]|nr:hypothetical protein C8R43DRAFT_956218 [Mycena crocata]